MIRDHRHNSSRSSGDGSWWTNHPHHARTGDAGHSRTHIHRSRRPQASTIITTITGSSPFPSPPPPPLPPLPQSAESESTVQISIQGTNVVTEISPWWSTMEPLTLEAPGTLSVMVTTSQPPETTPAILSQISSQFVSSIRPIQEAGTISASSPRIGSSPTSVSPSNQPPRNSQWPPSSTLSVSSIGLSPIPTYTLPESSSSSSSAGTPITHSTLALYSSLSSSASSSQFPSASNSTPQPPFNTFNPKPANHSSGFLASSSTAAKVGFAVGLVLFLLFLMALALLFLRRQKRHNCTPFPSLLKSKHNQRYVSLLSPPMSPSPPSPIPYQHTTSMSQRPNDSTPLIINAGEGKTSVDSFGIRWPENVVLSGEAQEVWELGRQVESEWRERKKISAERREEERVRIRVQEWSRGRDVF